MHKQQIKTRFNRASQTYDKLALIQKECATLLVTRLFEKFKTFKPNNILDLGSGTGNIIEALMPILPNAHFCLNDISQEMLNNAKEKFNDKLSMSFKLADMETLAFEPHELIISNFALQWTEALNTMLSTMFQHAKIMAFTTLLDGSFKEWQDILKCFNAFPLKTYPKASELKAFLLSLKPHDYYFEELTFSLHFENPRALLSYLKNIGASTPSTRINFSTLKQLQQINFAPFNVTYQVFLGIVMTHS